MTNSPDVCNNLAPLIAALPAGAARDELVALVEIGLKFRSQQRGKRPGFLARTIFELGRGIARPLTFEKVLDELELAAARRALYGEMVGPIEKVDRVWELLTYHDPRRGRRQVTFKRLRNLVTACKKNPQAQIPEMP